jgi:quercetin dioxygenase-like cupin family protein
LDKKNIYTTDEKQPSGEQPDFYSNKFIGNFEIRRIFNELDSKEQEMYHVIFKDGGMTKIHTHESEQILIATISSLAGSNPSDIGKGFVVLIEKDDNTARDDSQFNIGKIIFLNKIGDTVCIPPNVLHCHGSTSKEQDFSHIAIRRSILDNKQQAKSLWEYDTEAMKKVMGIDDDKKVSAILNELHNKIGNIISECYK